MPRLLSVCLVLVVLASLIVAPNPKPVQALPLAVGSHPSELTRLPFAGGPLTITVGPQAYQECGGGYHSPNPTGGFPRAVNSLAIDFAPSGGMLYNTPVVAAGDGTVFLRDDSDGKIVIAHGDGTIRSLYVHMRRDSIRVNKGDTVQAGQEIGIIGSEGLSSGIHLHFAATHVSNPSDHWTAGTPLDIRGLPGINWAGDIQWNDGGTIENCRTRHGLIDGTATGPPVGDRGIAAAPPPPACAGPDPIIYSDLAIYVSPTTVETGQEVTASFTVTNRGCADFRTRMLGAGGRTPDGQVVDFPMHENIVIPPGNTYFYSATRAFDTTGEHFAFAAWMDEHGSWADVPRGDGAPREAYFTVNACAARPELTSSLHLSTSLAEVGEEVTASYTVRNAGCTEFVVERIGVGGRGPGEENIQDFPFDLNVTIPPGGEHHFSATRSFDQPGGYGFDATYRSLDGEWLGIPTADQALIGRATLDVLPEVGDPAPSSMPVESSAPVSVAPIPSANTAPDGSEAPNDPPMDSPTEPPTSAPSTAPAQSSAPAIVPIGQPVENPVPTTRPAVPTGDPAQPIPTAVTSDPGSDPVTAPASPDDFGSLATITEIVSDAAPAHGVGNLFDGNSRTAWVEGDSGSGIGASFSVNFGSVVDVRSLTITNGFAASEALFSAYGAVARLEVSTDAGAITLDLAHSSAPQTFAVNLSGQWLTFTILDVYAGVDLPQDTAMSEVEIYVGSTESDSTGPFASRPPRGTATPESVQPSSSGRPIRQATATADACADLDRLGDSTIARVIRTEQSDVCDEGMIVRSTVNHRE